MTDKMNPQLPPIPNDSSAETPLPSQSAALSSSASRNSTGQQDVAEWSARIDSLVAETQNNPKKRADGIARLKAQYLYEVFGIQVKVKE